MVQGNIKGIFNNKRIIQDEIHIRYSLAHNLVIIAEGTTVSYSNDNNISPFLPFSYDNDGGISIIFWPSNFNIKNGDIIVNGGFTK